jgi:hypothetical protein
MALAIALNNPFKTTNRVRHQARIRNNPSNIPRKIQTTMAVLYVHALVAMMVQVSHLAIHHKACYRFQNKVVLKDLLLVCNKVPLNVL